MQQRSKSNILQYKHPLKSVAKHVGHTRWFVRRLSICLSHNAIHTSLQTNLTLSSVCVVRKRFGTNLDEDGVQYGKLTVQQDMLPHASQLTPFGFEQVRLLQLCSASEVRAHEGRQSAIALPYRSLDESYTQRLPPVSSTFRSEGTRNIPGLSR